MPDIAESDKTRWWIWLLVLAAGAFLFTFRSGRESLWMDEAFSIAMSNNPFADIWHLSGKDSHPPLYYLMLRAFRLLFGDSFAAARWLSAAGALALVALGIGPVRRAAGGTAGLVFSLLAVTMPATVAFAREARMYTWAMFFLTGAGLYAYLAIARNRRSDWVLFSLCTAASMYIHLYGLLGAFFIGLFSLSWVALKERDRLLRFSLAAGAPAVLFLPWAVVLAERVARPDKDLWLPEVTGGWILSTLAFPYGYKFDVRIFGYHAVALLALAALAGGLVLAVSRRKDLRLPALCLSGFAGTLIAATAISLVVRPILYPRYMLPLAGLLVVALAYAVAQFPKPLAVAACALIVLGQVRTLPRIIQERFNGPMREVAAYLEERAGPDDVFVHVDEHTAHTFAVYMPRQRHLMYLPPGAKLYSTLDVHGGRVRTVSGVDEIAPAASRAWLVTRHGGLNPEAYREAAEALGLPSAPLDSERHKTLPGKFFEVRPSWYAVLVQSRSRLE